VSFLGEVVGPVGVEVAVAACRAEFRMAWVPGSAQRAPVMSMRSLTRWRQAPSMTPVAIGQPRCSAGVVQVGGLVGQVGRAGVCAGALGGREVGVGGLAADRPRPLGGVAGEDLRGVAADPCWATGATSAKAPF